MVALAVDLILVLAVAAATETFLAAELDEILAPPPPAKLKDLATATAAEELVLTRAFEPEETNTSTEELPLLVPLGTLAPTKENPLPVPRAALIKCNDEM